METHLVQSIHGKQLLVVEKFTFSRQKILKSGEIFWRCTKKSTNCTAKIFTLGIENLVTRSHLVHNHEPEENKLNRKIISSACKRKAQEDISEKPSKIIRCELEKNLPETITTLDVTNIRRNIYYSRRKLLPGPLPKNVTEVHEILNSYSVKTSKNESFVFINSLHDNIIVFSCETNIRSLCGMDYIYMDGTFSYCTKYFLQLFTIHGLKNGHYIPLVFCILRDKRSETYAKLFAMLTSQIFERYSLRFQPIEVFIDFETAIHVAVRNTWPATKVNGCRFHLHQAWYRKIQSLGLSSEFKNKDSEIGRWLKHTFGLTYLCPDEVGDCFAFDLYSDKPHHPDVEKYADYLLDTYIDENAKFPPQMWANASPSIIHTTNACESFHSRFNGSFYATHPSIYIFIEKLKEFQIDTYVKLQSVHIPLKMNDKKTKVKLDTLTNLRAHLFSGKITRLHFVKCVSYYSTYNNIS